MAIWVADFETTTDPDDCRVWSWGAVQLDNLDNFNWGADVDSYVRWALKVGGEHYFHNLKFDGYFILDHLLKNGYRWVEKANRNMRCVSGLISDDGKFYTLTVSGGGQSFTCKDSLKKLPFSVSEVAGAFSLDMAKGDIDYHLPRPVNYVPTDAELDYLYRDCAIVAQALKIQRDSGLKRMTVGSDALHDYKSMSPFYRDTFPILSHEIDNDIRKAYRGGFTYVNPRYQNTIVGGGASYDVNSLYPYVMYHRPIPYGYPQWFDGEPEPDNVMPLWIATVVVELRLKPGHVPCVQVKGNSMYSGVEYITETVEPTELYVTNVDWDLMCQQYDVDVIYWHGGYKFTAAEGLFNAYIDKWMHVKQTTTGGLRTLAKLMLNSLYGKYATNPDVTGKYPELDRDRIKLNLSDPELREPVYTAAGVFITSYARDYTIRAAQALGDRFMYADTDSLHIRGTEPTDLWVDPQALGAWKHEYDFVRARYVRAKCYVEELADGENVVRVAGLPYNARGNITVETLEYGASFPGKLRPTIVPGGIVLAETDFTIR